MAYLELSSGAELSVAQAITTTASSTNIFDVTGAGVGNAPTMIGALGVNTALGSDLGAGQTTSHPGVLFTVTTAGTGAGTISFAIQAAPDSGTYTEGTYTTLTQTQAFVGTALTLGLMVYLPLPPVPSNYAGLPRFYKALYTVASSATVTLNADLLMNPPNVKSVGQYGKNFISAY